MFDRMLYQNLLLMMLCVGIISFCAYAVLLILRQSYLHWKKALLSDNYEIPLGRFEGQLLQLHLHRN